MNSYAYLLQKGDGIAMNKREAIRYYKMAIDKGSVNAMYNYGLMLVNGDGIAVNKREAARYFK
ncbi:hypothetical protein M9Y10_023792 [Tritrichomonas musculus]|uniref:Beta-lactamase n=1 Tax=Tritrichomonas musculus TaxID=1915356 RepID=A0ABR2KWP7_9EUKA